MRIKGLSSLLMILLAVFALGVAMAKAETISTKDYWVLTDGYDKQFTHGGQISMSYGTYGSYILEEVFDIDWPGSNGTTHQFFKYSSGSLMYYGARYRKSDVSSEWVYIPKTPQELLPPAVEVGKSYSRSWTREEYQNGSNKGEGSDAYTVTINGPYTTTVPAGSFTTYEFRLVDSWKTNTGDSGTTTYIYYLAKDIGWVKLIRDGVTYELGSYHGPPSAPRLSVTTSGVKVSLSWSKEKNADSYTLFYAPYPYTGANSISSISMRKKTSVSYDLWEGAAFFVAVKALNSFGTSGYSNICRFILDYSLSASPSSLSLAVAQTVSCTISGGVAPYSVASKNTAVATASVAGNTISIAGVSGGSTAIVVTDNLAGSMEVGVTVTSDTVYDWAAEIATGIVNEDLDILTERGSKEYLHNGMDQACRKSMYEWKFSNWAYVSASLDIHSVKDVSQGDKILSLVDVEQRYTIARDLDLDEYKYNFDQTLILEDGKWKTYGNHEGGPSPSLENMVTCTTVEKGQPEDVKSVFRSNDPAIYVHFDYTGLYKGDRMSYKWYSPGGQIWEGSWDFVWDGFPSCGMRNGHAWVWWEIDKYESWWEQNGGKWKVEIFINGSSVGQIYFEYK